MRRPDHRKEGKKACRQGSLEEISDGAACVARAALQGSTQSMSAAFIADLGSTQGLVPRQPIYSQLDLTIHLLIWLLFAYFP
ncbi:hypothetical protein PP1Y_Lpl1033 (plasmid) [Novosphingobium sp. PP1Y]|nr:hypothetical protein PP1Y_Lpl1033 [Novosphingobium sp. PP1Y]